MPYNYKLSTAISAGLLSFLLPVARGTTYTVTDLGTGSSSQPTGINNLGQIVGDTSYPPGRGDTIVGKAFLWQPTSSNAITGTVSYPMGSAGVSIATGINSSGQISGFAAPVAKGIFSTTLFTPTTANATAGAVASIPFRLPADDSFQPASGVNDSGQMVSFDYDGNALSAAIFTPSTVNGHTGSITDLASNFYLGASISNSGQVTGALAAIGSTYQAGKFVPTSPNGTTGTYVDIAGPGQGGTQFVGAGSGAHINSVGDVAGSGSYGPGQQSHALIWKANGQVIDLVPLLGGTNDTATGINDADQVVGDTASGDGFVYAGGTATDLNSLITDSSWHLGEATAINNAGQIVGFGTHGGATTSYLLTPVATSSQPHQWTSPASGDWNNANNWLAPAGIPNAAGAEADFFSAITTNRTVYTDLPVVVGILNFNNPNSYVVTGSSTLTLLASSGNTAQVIVQSGTQELNLPFYISSNASFNVAAGATLVIADPLTVIAGNHVATLGSGTITYESTVTLQSGASLAVSNPSAMAGIALAGNSLLAIKPHAAGISPTLLQTAALSIAPAGTLDVANNAVIVQNGNLAAIASLIQSGYAGGSWTGTGIISSSAQTDPKHLTTLGAVLNTNLYGASGSLGTFEGASPGVSDVLIKYTYYGDANLDGHVDGSDYTLIDNGFNNHTSGWVNGDFNYDGKVDGSDYTLIDNAFNTQGASLAAQLAAPQLAGSASVPEPVTLSIALTTLMALCARRPRANV